MIFQKFINNIAHKDTVGFKARREAGFKFFKPCWLFSFDEVSRIVAISASQFSVSRVTKSIFFWFYNRIFYPRYGLLLGDSLR